MHQSIQGRHRGVPGVFYEATGGYREQIVDGMAVNARQVASSAIVYRTGRLFFELIDCYAPALETLALLGETLKHALINMLTMQNSMNTRVHPDWINQNFEWYRAAWIECGELIEHYGYKWWKKQSPDMEQVRLEVIDIWHFGLSAMFQADKSIEQMAAEIEQAITGHTPSALDVREATEALALNALQTHGFSPALFWDLMLASGLDFNALYSAYVGKNVLNFFRQDNGYQDGSYKKNWDGKEDNEHLVELIEALDKQADDFAQQVYQALEQRYQELVRD